MRVAIIDCGSGNLRSAGKAFERAARERGINAEVLVTSDPEQLRRADRFVLPGQGAFKDCRQGLFSIAGLTEALHEEVRLRCKPFLGICVGMQLMATRGLEFGETPGLDWIAGEVRRICPVPASLKVPHVGWNSLQSVRPHPLLAGLNYGESAAHAYFVHSFAFNTQDPEHVLATTDYGGTITAAICRDNMAGTQFHPEKSQLMGLCLLGNFLQWRP